MGEEALNGNTLEGVVVDLFKQAGAHCASAEDCCMDNALKHRLAIVGFNDCLHHVVHKLDDNLLLLLEQLHLIVDEFNLATLPGVA